ncbi:hypothetical protein GALL_185140 [mine drainage metagenome]|uniref:Uncharacterized protein n=1 Tax=mine drainage metagenome TaxID=410659 RepID=A0A1J5RUI7_9ZZZZ
MAFTMGVSLDKYSNFCIYYDALAARDKPLAGAWNEPYPKALVKTMCKKVYTFLNIPTVNTLKK